MSALDDAIKKSMQAGIKLMLESMLGGRSFANLSTSAAVQDGDNAFTAERMAEAVALIEALGPRPPVFDRIACKSVKGLSDALERITGHPVEGVDTDTYTALGMWRVVVRDYMPENKAMLLGKRDIAILDLETGEIKSSKIEPMRFPLHYTGVS